MRNATISILGISKTHEVTKNMAHFKIMLPPGGYKLEINCHEYQTKTLDIKVVKDNITFVKVVLEKQDNSMTVETHEQTFGKGVVIGTGIRGKLLSGIKTEHTSISIHFCRLYKG